MNRKNNLLSIGELSKLSGVGIKSLRYYERINVLMPAYVEPSSGYRYYSFNQSHFVEIISLCTQLGIPLKELSKFIDTDDAIDFRAFLKLGDELADKKITSLKKGKQLIRTIEQRMDFAEKYQDGQIYTREIPQKLFHIVPCGSSLKDVDLLKLLQSFLDITYSEDDEIEFLEYGFLSEYSTEGVSYYAFSEVSKRTYNKHTKLMPAGIYHCKQSESSTIEQAPQIFKKYLEGMDSYLVIETEIFTGRHNVNRLSHEVRVIGV